MMRLIFQLNALSRAFWSFVGFITILGFTIVIIILTYIGIRGVPEEFERLVREQLEEYGIRADWDYIGFDPAARLVVRNFRCFDAIPGRKSTVSVQRTALEISWLALLRGEDFLRGLQIRRASLDVKTNTGESLQLDTLDANLTFHSERVNVEYFSASTGGATLKIRGILPRTFFTVPPDTAKAPSISPVEDESAISNKPDEWEGSLSRILSAARRSNLEVVVKIAPRAGFSWSAITAEASLYSSGGNYETVNWLSASAQLFWDGGRLTIPKFALTTPHGDLTFAAQLDSVAQEFFFKLHSDTPPDSVPFLLPEYLSKRFQPLRTEGKFSLDLEASGGIREIQNMVAHFTLDWQNIKLGPHQIQSISLAADLREGKLIIRNSTIQTLHGSLNFTLTAPSVTERLDITLDASIKPDVFSPLLPEAKAFFDSIKFNSPMDVSLTGFIELRPQFKMQLRGAASIGQFIYKQVEIKAASANFLLSPPLLVLEKVQLFRPEGSGSADRVDYDYVSPNVRLHNVRGNLFPLPTARIFGPKLEEYLAPYRFSNVPEFQVNGYVDLESGRNTDLRIFVQGRNFTYHLLGRDTPAKHISSNISITGNNLTIQALKASVDSGELDLCGNFQMAETGTDYQIQFALRNANMHAVMKGFFDLDDVTGTVTGGANIQGKLEDLRTMRGEGQISVRNGSLIDIPFLGALSQVTGLFDLGKARANEADATFRFDNGKIITNDLDIRSLTMALIGEGFYDYVNDNTQLDVRLNVRGPAGLLLFPVSKIFEYRGTGPLANVRWEPRILTPAVPPPQSETLPPLRGRNR